MNNIAWYKRLLSYVYPVLLRNTRGEMNSLLQLFLYRGRLQLATVDALYSDGDKYRPMVMAFNDLNTTLPLVKNVLLLGTGLGSAVTIMNKKGFYPDITMVDNDKVVLQLAMEFLPVKASMSAHPVCDDAGHFVRSCGDMYDMVIVDVFNGRIVPSEITDAAFFSAVKKLVHSNGHVVFNYIVNRPYEWQAVEKSFRAVFANTRILSYEINRVLVATV